jgi:N-acetylmuramic acid 6-phosphate etherase
MPRDSQAVLDRVQQFLKVAPDFFLGALVTEASHPKTANLSVAAGRSTAEGLAALFAVDRDVVDTYGRWSQGPLPQSMAGAALETLRRGGRVFFSGCGATGRLSIQLDSTWRAFWQERRARGLMVPSPDGWEDRTRSAMAGGDYALIKSVEGFEDFAPFGRRQVSDLGLAAGDTLFAITEGGETSFVIGTAWQGVEVGASVFFVYNNPDDVLRERVKRSREVLDDPRISKVNLTTGPMAVTGSTRMQATSIELLAILTVLEMVLRRLLGPGAAAEAGVGSPDDVPAEMRSALAQLHAELAGPSVIEPLSSLVEAEERVYRDGGRTSYFADALGIDVLTDTTERSPTFCTPSFRKHGDEAASESWAFLFTPVAETGAAWRRLLRREPQTIDWTDEQLRVLLDEDSAARQSGVLKEIGRSELMRFRIGLDGLPDRPVRPGDGVTVVVSAADAGHLEPGAPFARALADASLAGADAMLVAVGRRDVVEAARRTAGGRAGGFVPLVVPETGFLLDPLTRIGVKLLLNAMSTCTMVRLGRVLGNRMIWVVPSNLKLIDRSTRYIRDLTGVPYEEACRKLFEVIEYIEPRRREGRAYPPPVGVAVACLREGLSLEDAERSLQQRSNGRVRGSQAGQVAFDPARPYE